MPKKTSKKRPPSKKWEKYELEPEFKRKNEKCPKCGPGVFLARHKNRMSCGKCGYLEIAKK